VPNGSDLRARKRLLGIGAVVGSRRRRRSLFREWGFRFVSPERLRLRFGNVRCGCAGRSLTAAHGLRVARGLYYRQGIGKW
jgi:hypothetical protein